jgi:SNF2 family DNA or RNA helicase
LDLSYVTHIFLMDTILDSSLMQQVISRAYRMGCKQSVLVNQLIMRGTIEEAILRHCSLTPFAFRLTVS